MISPRIFDDVKRMMQMDTDLEQCLMKLSTHMAINGESRNVHHAVDHIKSARSMVRAEIEAAMISAVGNQGWGKKLDGS